MDEILYDRGVFHQGLEINTTAKKLKPINKLINTYNQYREDLHLNSPRNEIK